MADQLLLRRLVITLVAVALLTGGCSDSLAQKDVQPPPDRGQRKPTKEAVVDFEKAELGKTPAGFTPALTGGGGDISWVIVNDPSAPAGVNALAQTSKDKTSKRYPVCVYDNFAAKDADVTVRFKAISGEVDQAAGIL